MGGRVEGNWGKAGMGGRGRENLINVINTNGLSRGDFPRRSKPLCDYVILPHMPTDVIDYC
jgi:hypothetical protein